MDAFWELQGNERKGLKMEQREWVESRWNPTTAGETMEEKRSGLEEKEAFRSQLRVMLSFVS